MNLKNKEIKTNPMQQCIAAVSCGIVDGKILLDLNYEEDSRADIDANFVITENMQLVEVIPKATKKTIAAAKPTDEALLISKRSNDDLKTSLGCGYSVTYNCPKAERLYEGMRYLEVGDDQVLEAYVSRIERYEKSIHHHWKGPGLKPNKEWAWAIFHSKGELVSRSFAQEKYNNSLKGTQGGISYIKV